MVRLFLRRSDGTDSYLGSLASYRLIKFLAVGGIGVVVNLLAMALMFQVTGYRDWRASALASTIAALHNYFLNNHWTFADRRRSGSALFSGALLYLPMSAAGVAITTVTYSILTHARFRALLRDVVSLSVCCPAGCHFVRDVSELQLEQVLHLALR